MEVFPCKCKINNAYLSRGLDLPPSFLPSSPPPSSHELLRSFEHTSRDNREKSWGIFNVARTASNLSIEFVAEAEYYSHPRKGKSKRVYVRISSAGSLWSFVNALLKLVCKTFFTRIAWKVRCDFNSTYNTQTARKKTTKLCLKWNINVR